jgi:PBP1b-binding outer membrane lipoprotein LpoB
MKKKFIKFFVLCLISAVVLQGCSNKDDASSQETTDRKVE